MTHRIFLCYSRVDRPVVESLADLLRRAYDHVWFDENLHGGEEWWSEILKEIRGCDHFILLMSEEALESEWCQHELTEARSLDKHIVPVLVRSRTRIPEDLGRIQYVDMSSGVNIEGLNQLYATLIRYNGHKSVTREVQLKQERSDRNLLEQLWPFVNGRYIEILTQEMQAMRVDWELYGAHITKYLDWRSKERSHFFNPTLEEAFDAFDDALIRLDGQLAWTYELNEKENERPYMAQPRGSRHDSYWIQKYNKLVRSATDVLMRHVEMVRAIQTIVPGFDSSTEG